MNKLLKISFQRWKKLRANIISEKGKCSLIQQNAKTKILKISLKKWIKRTKKVVYKNSCMEKYKPIAVKGKIKHFWKIWRAKLEEQLEENHKDAKADSKYLHFILVQAFRSLSQNVIQAKWKRTYKNSKNHIIVHVLLRMKNENLPLQRQQ